MKLFKSGIKLKPCTRVECWQNR